MSGVGLAAGAIVSAVGAGVNANAQHKNAQNQKSQVADSAATQAGLGAQAGADVAKTAQSVGQSTPAAGTNQLLGEYRAALSRAQPGQSAALPAVSGANPRYAKGVASAKANVNDYASAMAKNQASIGGAQLQRIGDAQKIAQTASDLGALQTQSGNTSGDLKTQLAGDQANPWQMALGDVVQGAGKGIMSSGLGSMGGGTPPTSGGTPSTNVDFKGVDANTGAAIGPSFMGAPVTPSYSTGFNAANSVGYRNPFL